MTKIRVTPPSGTPIALADAKAHMRVDSTSEDDLITSLIAAAGARIEAETELALLSQTWRLYLDAWPPDLEVEIAPTPVLSVDDIVVYDAAGDPASVPTTGYLVDRYARPARIRLTDAGSSPGVEINGIEIDFTAGFGSDPADIPEPLRQAMLLLIAHWYENRQVASDGRANPVPAGYAALVAPYRNVRL